MTPVSFEAPRHACGVPGCTRRPSIHYYACNQHRALLGYELSCTLQQAWRERHYRDADFQKAKREALKKWGWSETEAAKP